MDDEERRRAHWQERGTVTFETDIIASCQGRAQQEKVDGFEPCSKWSRGWRWWNSVEGKPWWARVELQLIWPQSGDLGRVRQSEAWLRQASEAVAV
jgi:hypothetical protein